MDKVQALKNAIDIAVDGNQAQFARLLGRKPQEVWNWINRDMGAPAEVCPSIRRLTNGQVRCEDLCPEVDWEAVRIESVAPPKSNDAPPEPQPAAAQGA